MRQNNRKYHKFREETTGRVTQKKPKSAKHSVQRQDRNRLLQLVVCLALFLMVFIGKGVFPSGIMQMRDRVLSVLTADTNFRALLSEVGDSLAAGTSVYDTLGDLCIEVFGMEENPAPPSQNQPIPQLTSLLASENRFLSGNPTQALRSNHYQDPGGLSVQLPLTQPISANGQQDVANVDAEPEESVAAVGALLMKSNYSGQALPDHYTMDHLSLGELETTTPVLGHINSDYGYRDHPINGEYQFHGGLDIGGQSGDPILAFAAGTVEYVGEDDSYGLYLQLDHGNGIKSFYAHCRSIGVKKGQTVKLGEQIGEVGSSGSATGPHLHLELKCNGIHLDPIYYVDSLSDQ